MTDQSRTPRVDAMAREHLFISDNGNKVEKAQNVDADFARTLELEAADLRERLAKAREEAIEECARECDKVGRMLSYGAGYACKIAAKEIRALKQKGADHE